MFYLKLFIIFFNILVAFLNFKEYTLTKSQRDFWGGVAWLGSATSWFAQTFFL